MCNPCGTVVPLIMTHPSGVLRFEAFRELLLVQHNLQRYTQRALACLTPREAAIINRRLGLNDRPAETLEQISGDLHISRERVRQIATAALDKLKQHEAMLLACAEQ